MMDRQRVSGDRSSAVALCLLLMTAWTVFGWDRLTSLWLPDTDDMMRMQQVRDWLGGQAFADITQHRLSPPGGLPMHWTRVADLLPAGLILALTPAIGLYMANVWSSILTPAILFLAFLMAILRIYREIDDDGDVVAPLVIAGLAFPVMGLFQPGRVDHHGLQMVLLAFAVSAVLARPVLANGLLLGATTALSLAIGLETAPFLVVLLICVGLFWLKSGADERMRLLGAGGSLALLSFVFSQTLMPAVVPAGLCDAFSPPIALAGMIGGGALAFLGLVGGVNNVVLRIAVGALVAGGVGLFLAQQYPACLGNPYDAIDPVVARHWLSNVEEAQGLLVLGLTRSTIGHAGLVVVGLLAALWQIRIESDRRGQLVVLILGMLASLGLMLFQLRGAYGGVIMAIVPLAVMVNSAREKGPVLLVPAWLVSIGIVYDQVPRLMPWPDRAPTGGVALAAECSDPLTMVQLAKLPKMRIVAPMDFGAYAIGATFHSVYAAPYHRNNSGNRLMYDILLDEGDAAAGLARKNGVTHILVCPSARSAPSATLAARLATDRAPGWVQRVRFGTSKAMLYRVRGIRD